MHKNSLIFKIILYTTKLEEIVFYLQELKRNRKKIAQLISLKRITFS